MQTTNMRYFHDSFQRLQYGHPFNFHIFHNFIHLGTQDLSQWVKVSYGDPFYVITSIYFHNARWSIFEFKHVKIKEFHNVFAFNNKT